MKEPIVIPENIDTFIGAYNYCKDNGIPFGKLYVKAKQCGLAMKNAIGTLYGINIDEEILRLRSSVDVVSKDKSIRLRIVNIG